MQSHNSPVKLLFVALAIAMLLALAAFLVLNSRQASAPTVDSRQSTAGQTSDRANTGQEDNEAAGKIVTITFTDSGFEPNTIEVKKGTRVVVKNDSTSQVQFSSDEHPSHRNNPEMNLSLIEPGESDTYTAARVGTWGFHDHIDDTKTGTITITE